MTAIAMIPDDIRAEILNRIARAEAEHGVTVLLAIESGSRAWGFASPNSDYDARFIYVHPRDWYLSIDVDHQRDVIEYPIVDDIDLNGWDLRKALGLFARSNPGFVEWIQSPIVYVQRGDFTEAAQKLLPQIYSNARGIHHYRSMTKTTYLTHLQTDLVKLKKYFYALRPLLCVRWIERYQTPAPIEFQKLLHLIDDQPELLADIHTLIAKKMASLESGVEPQVPRIQAFIAAEIERMDRSHPEQEDRRDVITPLNALFRSCIRE